MITHNDYFYLEGSERKGPVNIDKLKSMNLPEDTWVIGGALVSWTKIKDVPELVTIKNVLQKKPTDKNEEPIKTVVNDKVQPNKNGNNHIKGLKLSTKRIVFTTITIIVSVVNLVLSIKLLKPFFLYLEFIEKEGISKSRRRHGENFYYPDAEILSSSTLSGVILLCVTFIIGAFVIKHLYLASEKK